MNSNQRTAGLIFLLLATAMTAVNYEQIVKWLLMIDERVAVFTNSIIGQWQLLDKTLIALTTTKGDIVILSIICLGFLIHGLLGKHPEIFVSRISYWIWVGSCAVAMYLGSNLIDLGRHIPLESLPELFDVRSNYGCVLRTDPDHSFPSGHSFAYSFFALMAFKRYPAIGKLFLVLLALTIGMRLALGIHWLTDIVIGGLGMTFALERFLAITRLETFLLPKIEVVTRFCASAISSLPGGTRPSEQTAQPDEVSVRQPSSTRI